MEQGGGISIDSAVLNVTGSEVNDNVAGFGGGIYAFDVDLNLQSTKLRRNVASFDFGGTSSDIGQGGALWVDGSSTSLITSSAFQLNTAGAFGGAIFNGSDNLTTITSSFIGGNMASGEDNIPGIGGGGGIYNSGDRLTINSSTIQNNRALGIIGIGEGGGIFSDRGVLEINFSSILRNNAAIRGGGISIRGGEATLFETNVGNLDGDGNRAGLAPDDANALDTSGRLGFGGGGIFVGSTNFTTGGFEEIADPAKLTVFGGVIANNVSNNFGGGVYGVFADVTFRSASGESETMVIANRALRTDGGGLYASGGRYNLVDAVFEENESRSGAGIFAIDSAELRLSGAEIRLNEARIRGGGLFTFRSPDVTLIDTTIEDNTPPSSFDGVF